MKKQFIICIFISSFATLLYGQNEVPVLSGTVSFVTPSNVYVKFSSTKEIKIGETLQFSGADCLRVVNKSSTSIVCSVINNCEVEKGDSVSYKKKESEETETIVKEVIPAEVVYEQPTEMKEESVYTEKIRGRVSVASYNLFSDAREDRHRLMTRFSMNANHINNSKFSVESYLAYRKVIVPTESNYSGRTDIFNIYNLNVRYDATPTFSATLGRRINPKASSLGAVDGLQLEKYFGNFYVGAMGGFRPDFENYGFNADLLQYGAYLGVDTKSKDITSQTTVGAMEQTNSGATDRRYIYLQHFSTIASNLSIFSSMELDIFSATGNETRLTNLYLSLRYRFSRNANVTVSYDSRKQIIYYETYQTDIDRILDEDLARQGIRARLNVRPMKLLWVGFSYSSRFQSDDQNKSDNIYGYATLSKIPKVGGRLNLSYNINSSNYLTSNIFSTRYSRDLVKSKLSGDLYYRLANYSYENRENEYSQNTIGLGLSYRISRSWQFNISGESTKIEDENNYRFYTMLTKRF